MFSQDDQSRQVGPVMVQKFEFLKIPRSTISLAEYNPRVMSFEAKKRLTMSLEKFGLVEAVVWNKSTGRLVGGHQRVQALDRIFGFPKVDYLIGVSAVTLNERREKMLNVWLNNESAQGNFDRDKRLSFLNEGITVEDMGFVKDDLEVEIGTIDVEPVTAGDVEIAPDSNSVAPVTAAPKGRAETATVTDHILIVFGSNDERAQWLEKLGFNSSLTTLDISEATTAILAIKG